MASGASDELKNPDHYIDRELSLISFNRRVLAQAKDPHIPLLERVRFLSIVSCNLDEFFEIRVATLKQEIAYNAPRRDAAGIRPQRLLEYISEQVRELVHEQYTLFYKTLVPELNAASINLCLDFDKLNSAQQKWVKHYVKDQLLPLITPVGLDYAHPFPRIVNKSLSFIVSLEGKDAFGRDSGQAIVHLPSALPHVIRLPEELDPHQPCLIFLSTLLLHSVNELFPGMKANGCYPFRLTRNSELFFDEEAVDDLANTLEGVLLKRMYGSAARLEVAADCPEAIQAVLLSQFELENTDLYIIEGGTTLNQLHLVAELIDIPSLKYDIFMSTTPKPLRQKNIFHAIAQQDILLHHPFESFTPMIELIEQAADDPNTLVIKQTLYRSATNSRVIDALVKAARSGKAVTAVIELRARFDEAQNIQLANRLQQAGVLVVYGIVDYKTHAKMTLIVRREEGQLNRYIHLGTGNYHEGNARQYTDYGLLSHDPVLADDVHHVFQQLTGMGKTSRLKKLLQAPFTLHKHMQHLIRKEAEQAQEGNPAYIILKMNALTEPSLIRELYKASQAGVEIDLIIRGMCCLRPGIKGLSERIRVRSIVGRFLEHSRVYYFYHQGEEKVFCSSADWMERNLYRRVEVCFPIEHPTLKARVIQESLKNYLQDNTSSWQLNKEGEYHRNKANTPQKEHTAQLHLLQHISLQSK